MMFVVILAWFIYCLLSYYKIQYGLALVVLLLPSYLFRFSIFGLPSTFLELMIVSLFVIWLLKSSLYKKINFSFKNKAYNFFDRPTAFILSLWLLASILSLAINPNLASLGLWRAYFLEPMMFLLVFVYSIKSKEDKKLIVDALAFLVVWLFALAIYQNFSNWNLLAAYNFPNVKRLTSIFSYPNALSLITAPLAGFMASFWFYSKEKIKNLHYLLAAILALLLAFWTVSQGAIAAIFSSLFIWLILAKKTRKIAISFSVIVLIVAFIFLPIGSYINRYSQELTNPLLDLEASSLEIRSSQWSEASVFLAEHPLTGAGLNGYQEKIKDYHQHQWLEIYLYPHNIFLNFWMELGFFGLLVFIALLYIIIIKLKKLFEVKSAWAWPLTLFWSTWFIHGLVDVPYFKNDLSVLFFIFFGLTLIANKNEDK